METKTYFITGATGGIGFNIACQLAKENSNIILCGRDDAKLEQALNYINTLNKCRNTAINIDLENIVDIKEKFNNIVPEYDIINGFIHCAGIALFRAAHLTDYNKMLQSFNINYFSFVEISRLFSKQFFTKNNQGNIVAISSIAAYIPESGRIAYSSSKAALEVTVKVLAQELVKKNIRCNIVRPSLVNTNMAAEFFDLIGTNPEEQNIQPLGIIEPDEISHIVKFILSRGSNKITGSIFEINAGGGFDVVATFKEIAGSLNINKNEIILLSTDVSLMSFEAVEHNNKFNADEFLNIIISKIGVGGTLILPVYNWNFCRGVAFDYHNTIGKTGYLGNAALKRDDFRRTKHPIYSFAVWGHDREYLCSIDPVMAFDKGSIFEYLHIKGAKNIAIDVHFNDHYTMCHYAEQITGVPYRYNKYFKAYYIDEDGNCNRRTYSMSVRYLELNMQGEASALYHEFIHQHAAYEEKIDKHVISYIDIAKTIPIMTKDLKEDNGRLQVQYASQFLPKLSPDKSILEIHSRLTAVSNNNKEILIQYIKDNYLGELITEHTDSIYGRVLINGYSDRCITIEVLFDNTYIIATIIEVIKYIYSMYSRYYSYIFVFTTTCNDYPVIINNNGDIKHIEEYKAFIDFISSIETTKMIM